jgi:hypothetical protein
VSCGEDVEEDMCAFDCAWMKEDMERAKESGCLNGSRGTF